MTRWIYIIAIAGEAEEDPISFKHVFVEAKDQDEAYSKGQRLMIPERRPGQLPRSRFLNDYTVNVEEKLLGFGEK